MTTDDAARTAVLDAADRLFYSTGVQSVGMAELRSAAGIPLKRIYQLFPSKDEILRQVLVRRNEEWTRRVLARAGAVDTPREKLLSIYDFLGDWFREDDFRGCAFINSFGELGAVDHEVASFARQHKESFQHYLAGIVKSAGAPTTSRRNWLSSPRARRRPLRSQERRMPRLTPARPPPR